VDLAAFLRELQAIDTSGGPEAGEHSFFRGGHPNVYDADARRAIAMLAGRIDAAKALRLWEAGLRTAWDRSPVWAHGDISPGNLLVRDSRLCAVIDFGCLAVGDPACDLAIAWSFFDSDGRGIFRRGLDLDDATWMRGRAWALWKAAIVVAGLIETNAVESSRAAQTLDAVCADEAS
jgi:aminoglycoside phosphotransferase (APT) family kinase protein